LSFSKNSFAHIEKNYILYGTIGEREVIVEMLNLDNFWNGRYCYLDEKIDRYMKTRCDSFGCKMQSIIYEKEKGAEKVMETITIYEDSLFNWHGTMKDSKGETKEIFLSSLYVDSIESNFDYIPYVKTIGVYNAKRIADLKFKKIKTEKLAKGLKLDWYIEPISGVKGFRLGRGFDKKLMDKANLKLEENHLRNVEMRFGCGTVGFQGIFNQSIDIKFANSYLISYVTTIESNCQNLKPGLEKTYFTFSVDSGEFLKLEDIFWLGEGGKPRNGSQEYYKYRYNLFGNAILKMLVELYPDSMVIGPCKYNNPKYWQFPEWYLTPEGICFVTMAIGLPANCKGAKWPVIPFQKIEGYIEKKYFEDL